MIVSAANVFMAFMRNTSEVQTPGALHSFLRITAMPEVAIASKGVALDAPFPGVPFTSTSRALGLNTPNVLARHRVL